MIIRVGDKFIITTIFNDKEIILEQSFQWSRWLRDVKSLASNTLTIYGKALERFWIWSLYNTPNENEHLALYFSSYVKKLQSGFTINETIFNQGEVIEIKSYISEPMADITINKEIAAVESFLQYVNMDQVVFSDKTNMGYIIKKTQNSFLGAIEIKASDRYTSAFGKKETFLKKKKIRAKSQHDLKAFPYNYFVNLLEVTQPREKLIYLLAGITSARIGQILNLTLYDIDYENKQIWLIDPKSDETDIYGNRRKQWLLEKYGIDINKASVHNTFANQFKYPIPRIRGPLHWISNDMKEMFFETLIEYKKTQYFVPEYKRNEKHPFFFTTGNGTRLSQAQVYATFKSNIQKLVLNISQIDEAKKIQNVKGLHSLRHMSGTIMADIYSQENKDVIINITKDMFGHSSLNSTMVYFENTSKVKRKMIKEAGEKIFNK
ncbi:tyrosine-type recombinase/integrase [Arcobacter lacus]|uniref:tyrosine-type recombinase/integrase n=1 Tax=Arcobacter lacus TaxID=1912876 RepID=UPI0021BAD8CD|nr:tyrosine-type recombinase/integrase [Arcobacter lacus]MCT7908447.1 tyrosine-type recombinase/integrase [Arcobacter lacus]